LRTDKRFYKRARNRIYQKQKIRNKIQKQRNCFFDERQPRFPNQQLNSFNSKTLPTQLSRKNKYSQHHKKTSIFTALSKKSVVARDGVQGTNKYNIAL
jgi:hypothetical protein